jgi:hypothetical protein
MVGMVAWLLAATLLSLGRPGGVDGRDQAGVEGWLTYTDDATGYSVLYPPGWAAHVAFENTQADPAIIRRRVSFEDPQGMPIAIDVWEREPGLPIQRWLQEVEQIESIVEANAVIGGQDALVLVQGGGCGAPAVLAAYLAFGDRVYKIHYPYAGEGHSLEVYGGMLRSFSLADTGSAALRPTTLPDLRAMVPATCGTNLCPSTCSGGCTYASISDGCCGYHAIPKWQCARECIGSEVGSFQGNCVWWGAYTRPDVGALASGNAQNWATSVRNTGQLPVDTTPKVGDIVVHPGSSYNHVAYVVWVSPDATSYMMSDMGWCSDCGPAPEETKLRSVDGDDEFIHCQGDPAVPTTDWLFGGCPFGWTPSKGFSASAQGSSGWSLNPADDPYLLSPVLSVPAGAYDGVAITMAHTAESTSGMVSFTTASCPDFDEGKVVGFSTINDGSSREYVVPMSDNAQWEGTITRLRVDPVEAGNGDGSDDEITMARIRLVRAQPVSPVSRISLPLVVCSVATSPTCVDQIRNGGFETNSAWEIPATAYPAGYTTVKAHGGSRSMRVGIVDPADNVYSYSSIRQVVAIPADAASATLRFWLYPMSEEAGAVTVAPPPLASPEDVALATDAQYVLVLNLDDVRIGTLLWQLRDDRVWSYHEADLTDYAGQTIKLQFGVYNDGVDGVTGLYMDDVSLLTCSP